MSVTPEIEALIYKLGDAQTKLTAAKRFLEEVRKLGVDAEQEVVVARTVVHGIKDEIAALVEKMKEDKKP